MLAVPDPRAADNAAPGQPGGAKTGRSWDERLGPIGITICAVTACALAWWLAHSYHLF
jgi:hypothetical protein